MLYLVVAKYWSSQILLFVEPLLLVY